MRRRLTLCPVPALGDALGTGLMVIRALAAFGEAAAPKVLAVLADPIPDQPDRDDTVSAGLIALRFMVENASMLPLTPVTRDRIGRMAEHYLMAPATPPSSGTVLCDAIDLALALDDPSLVALVVSLAHDRKAIMARGVIDPELVERVQRHAMERLAGFPARPQR